MIRFLKALIAVVILLPYTFLSLTAALMLSVSTKIDTEINDVTTGTFGRPMKRALDTIDRWVTK